MSFEIVPVDELWDLTLEIPLGIDHWKRLNKGLDCIVTLTTGCFVSTSLQHWLQCHSIHEAIGKSKISAMLVLGTDKLEGALNKALSEVKVGECGQGVGLH
jgi:hypothetical protein